MRRLIAVGILSLGLAHTHIVSAQETTPSEQAFRDFFATFVASEWDYHTRMTGPDGETRYETTDIRTYRFGMRNRFVIEDVYASDDGGDRILSGVQLIGLDAESGTLHISQFWPWQPTLLGDVTARIEAAGGGRPGIVGVARPAGQDHPTYNFECEFQSDDVFRCVTEATPETGERYRSNVETFTRRD